MSAEKYSIEVKVSLKSHNGYNSEEIVAISEKEGGLDETQIEAIVAAVGDRVLGRLNNRTTKRISELSRMLPANGSAADPVEV